MKFSTKLTLLFLLLSLAPLALAGYLAYGISRRAIEQNTHSRLVANTIFKKDEFNRWLDSTAAQLGQFARRPLVRGYTETLTNPNATTAEQQAARDMLLDEHFKPTVAEEVGFLELFLLDGRSGQILASTHPNHEGMYRRHEAYFIEGQKDTFIDRVHYSVNLGQAVMHASTPVRDESGAPVAVLAGRLDLSIMTEIMNQASGLNPSEESYLVNSFNFFVTNPKLSDGDVALKKAVYTAGVQSCLAGNTGVDLYTDYRGVPVLGAYRWLPEREMCLLTEIDQAEAFIPVRRLGSVMAGVGGLIAGVVALLALLFARTITHPIQELVKGTEAVGRGNLDYRINVLGRDELAELAAGFNQMAARRQQDEQKLREQQVFLQSIYQNTEMGVFVVDVPEKGDFCFAGLNPAHERLTGLKSEEVAGKTLDEALIPHIPPQAVAAVRANYTRCVEAGRTVEYEEMIPMGGQDTWWLTKLSPVRNAEQRIVRIIGSSLHITGRKQMEGELRRARDELELRVRERTAALRESEERLRRAVLDAPIPVIIHAADGRILMLSQTWTDLTGYTPAEIPTIGDWTERAYGERMKLVRADIDRLYGLQEKVDEGEYEITTRDGKKLIWTFSSAPLGRLPDGRRLVISMAMDVTKRKQAELALAHQAQELARSNQELEQFAYVASHDLQEPLRMVTSYLQLIERRYKDALDEDGREFIGYAVDGSNRMKSLINDLLAYSRVGTRGKEPEMVNSEFVLERVLNNLQLAIEDEQATITYNSLPTVLADAGQLEQLLQNLISNALKFHGRESPTIQIGAEQQNHEWLFWVKDNGVGFEPEYAEKIFVIFQRLHNRQEYSGTGIGLAICKKIVERHGGRIWVESQPGQGATFYFTLPAISGQ